MSMEAKRRVSSWCVPEVISWRWAVAGSYGGAEVLGLVVGGRKPREAGGALSRPCSMELMARSAIVLMLLIMSSRRL